MPGLFGTLAATSQALQAQSYALDITGQNIANVNTPGYARRTVNLETGTTFILVTHNPEVAEACDRTIVMRDGAVVDLGVTVG